VLQNDGSVVIRQVTIGVTPVAATPTPVPPTATPAASTLPGTRWEVVNYNDGNALVTLISGTRITMEFGSDGQVRGTAGCNTYFASFQAGGSTLTIGQPGSTSQFCAEPAGVMDQEARFLSTLPRSASYRVDGNRLDIRSAADQIIIVANRAP
jgi:heat shock protein HslJ